MAVEWTDKQKNVINTRDRNILVSAAAGSGKTAVLVERIIQKILDAENPVDVDKLLVVTFTKAAAAEMRERVLEALERASGEQPDNEHLQKQQTYIHNANITTIDSFCARIVREHFDVIDIDPNTRIVDEAEMKMLESDVLSDMMEEYFEKSEESFLRLADKYTDPKRTSTIEELISMLYKSAVSHVNPKKWLNDCREAYDISCMEDMENTLWMKKLKSILKNNISGLIEKADEVLKICSEDDGPAKYYDDIALIKEALLRIDCNGTYDEIRKSAYRVEFGRLPSIRKDTCDENLKEQAKKLREEIKKSVAALHTELLSQSSKEIFEDISATKETADTFINLTLDFYERFLAEKKEKCIMDFSDQEHYALEILVDFDEMGGYAPSGVARDISVEFEEIMIDEYQDSNYVQEAILTSLSKGFGVNNVFMVGDVKQSIYKFRLANPNLFIEKYDSYSEELDAAECKIILDKNFRSRKEIIESVNFIFQRIMKKDLGGIDYEDGNALSFGADYYATLPQNQDNRTELLLVEGAGNENEARAVAARIRELVQKENGFMITAKDGSLRKPEYKDIVILLRSVKNRGDEYVKILSEEGIPAYCESRTGYYEAKEVKTVIDYLKVIDNPLQDIPFASVMRSAMYHFSSRELAVIKAENEREYYYDCVKCYLENGRDSGIKEKIEKLFYDLNRYRSKASYTSVYDLITMILKETGYGNYILALPNGRRRSKNLDILREKAITYDAGSYKGLFNFVRYIEKIDELGIDEGEASPVSENDNIVRIMTFHKSKGLQFPIVFVSGLGTKFNNRDTTEKLAVHEEYGIGFDYMDDVMRVKKPTVIKSVINKIIKEENYAEYIRFLYVALTRAQEKMILTASDGNMEKKLEGYISSRSNMAKKVSYGSLIQANSMMDWIGRAVAGNKCFDDIVKAEGCYPNILHPSYQEDSNMICRWLTAEDVAMEAIENEISDEIRKEQLSNINAEILTDVELKNHIIRNLNWRYPYVSAANIPAKLSVTEIKKLSMAHNEEEDGERLYKEAREDRKEIIPEFLSSDAGVKKLSGAERGTAYHRIFELFDFDMEPTRENIEKMIIKLEEGGKINKETVEAVVIEDFVAFTKSNLYRRMKRAHENNLLYRERSFMMGVYANHLETYKDSGSNEIILVQGILDVCFVENGKYVIADYKTDKVDTMQSLVDKYAVQLNSYREAVNRIENPHSEEEIVSEMIIYSVKLGEEIQVPIGKETNIKDKKESVK